MGEPERMDLWRLDRDIAGAVSRLSRWRAALAADPARFADSEPLGELRYVAGQTTWEALAPSDRRGAAEAPLAAALRRWSYTLLQARLARELDADWAREVAEPRGRLFGESPRLVSYAEAWRGLVASRVPAEGRLWLDAAAGASAPLAPLARERAQRRLEIARRLGLAHPAEPTTPAPVPAILEAARQILLRTSDLARDALRDARGPDGRRDEPSFLTALPAALARDAAEGWPARLTPRWLEDLFADGTRGLRVELPALPRPLGASSFARALGAFGFALHVAGRRGGLFALAHDPEPAGAHRFGFAFAALAAWPEFHRRALGTGARRAGLVARSVARAGLLHARELAARALLLDDLAACSPRADAFAELTAQVFGAPLPAALAGAWPAHRGDERARLYGLAGAAPLFSRLVERFDADWFRNPRAVPHLVHEAQSPAPDAGGDVPVAPLVRAFEEALA